MVDVNYLAALIDHALMDLPLTADANLSSLGSIFRNARKDVPCAGGRTAS